MSTRHGTLTRAIAIDVLTHVLSRKMHSDAALEKLFAIHKELRPLDKAFVYEMVFGSLRWLSKMDWIMGHMMDRPFSTLDPRVANALRVGTYQIYYMDRVPERAAVSETVEAIKKVGVPNATSFVNAILRRVAKKSEYFPKPDKEKNRVEYFAMHYAHPAWMIERWSQYLPNDRLEYLLINNNKLPKNTIRILKRNALPADETDLPTYLLKKYSIHSEHRPLAGAWQLESLPPFSSCEAFAKGCYLVQDEAAQLVCSVVKCQDGDTFLDACAAPGGKSITLWDEGLDPAHMSVCDSSQKRMRLIHENFERVGLKGATILTGDVVEQCAGKKYTKVLIDAPCSAMGVIKRHPEIKWHRNMGDIQQCVQNQKYLLNGLAACVAPGGELIYATCSFEPEETTLQIEAFLQEHPEFERVPIQDRLHDFYKKYVIKNELVIYGSNPDELDGFYCAVLKRV